MRRPAVSWLVLTACLALVTAGSSTAGRSSARASRTLVIYSQTTAETFLAHQDDRIRGDQNNPFGKTFSAGTAAGLTGHGPFAGDRAVFTFKLFSDTGLSSQIGTATYDCQYAFGKHGICQTEYILNGGSLLGMGYLDFNAKTFSIAVTGGTGKYRDSRGDVLVTPNPNLKKRGNRLAFTLV